ncbi:MAG: hypothetical protein U0235_28020 [Polyangiaceae bacterium]
MARALTTAKFAPPRGRGVILTIPISVGQDRGDVPHSASRDADSIPRAHRVVA